MSFRAPSIKCFICDKTVYAVELIKADGRDFHSNCLKCSHCKKTLKLGNFASLNGSCDLCCRRAWRRGGGRFLMIFVGVKRKKDVGRVDKSEGLPLAAY